MPLRDEIFCLTKTVVYYHGRREREREQQELNWIFPGKEKEKKERELKWIFFFKLGAGVGKGHFKQNLGGAVYGQ